MIHKATKSDMDTILHLAHTTISTIYPRYYPKGVVDFFLYHHSPDNIRTDIAAGLVWLLEEDGPSYYGVSHHGQSIGTVTIKENSINRLFVLPECQGRGYGSQLMDFAEQKVGGWFDTVYIDSSLPAKEMYQKRGYKEVRTCHIRTNSGDVLVYDEMEKKLPKMPK